MKFIRVLSIEYTRQGRHHVLFENVYDFINACQQLNVSVVFAKKKENAIRYVAFVGDLILEYIGYEQKREVAKNVRGN